MDIAWYDIALNVQALIRLNRLGVTMSTTTKLRLLDEASGIMDKGIVSRLQKSPLVKITGDNLDMYIRTGQKSLEKSNRDLHLFTSNVLFNRVQ